MIYIYIYIYIRPLYLFGIWKQIIYFKKILAKLCDFNIKVARDEDLKEQIGKDIYFDLVDHDKVRSFRIQKQVQFASFKVF